MEFKVYPEKLHNAANQMRELDGEYEAYSKTVAEAKGILQQYSLDSSCESLEKINDRIETQRIKNSVCYNTLDNIARSYEECEKGIKGESDSSFLSSSETENVVSLSGWNIITGGGIGIIGSIVNRIRNNKDQKESENVVNNTIGGNAKENYENMKEYWDEYYKKRDEEILDEMRKRDAAVKERLKRDTQTVRKSPSKSDRVMPPENYKDYCGDYANDQLRDKGLSTFNVDSNEVEAKNSVTKMATYGYKFADKLANYGHRTITDSNGVTRNVTYEGYSSFDEMLEKNPQPIYNIVCSWDKGGPFKENVGHAMLIDRIENGKVYFMDNRKNLKHQDGTPAAINEPMCLTIDEFKRQYNGNWHKPGKCCTVCKGEVI